MSDAVTAIRKPDGTLRFEVDIAPGDFIRAASMGRVVGFVLRAVDLKMGPKRKLPGYVIRTANGGEDFISEDEAVLVSPSYERWQQIAACQAMALGPGPALKGDQP